MYPADGNVTLRKHSHDSRQTSTTQTNLNDALQSLEIVAVSIGKYAKCCVEKCRVLNKELDTIFPRLLVASVIRTAKNRKPEPKTAKCLAEKSKNQLCRLLASAVETKGWKYSYNCSGIFIRVDLIDWVEQKSVPRSHMHSIYKIITANQAKFSSYNKMRRKMYCLHIANDVCTMVNDLCHFACSRAKMTQARHPKLFLPKWPALV